MTSRIRFILLVLILAISSATLQSTLLNTLALRILHSAQSKPDSKKPVSIWIDGGSISVLEEEVELYKMIGRGNTAKVYLAKDKKTKKGVVVKRIGK